MTADALFARLRRRPFVPFRMYLSGGTSYDVLRPEMMFVTKSGITLAVYDHNPSPDEGSRPGGVDLFPAHYQHRRPADSQSCRGVADGRLVSRRCRLRSLIDEKTRRCIRSGPDASK